MAKVYASQLLYRLVQYAFSLDFQYWTYRYNSPIDGVDRHTT